MKKLLLIAALLSGTLFTFAQNKEKEKDEEDDKIPFRENLFTGGSVSLAFYNNTFLIGGSPVFGYSFANWADAGVVVNYNYTSYKNYQAYNDRLKQTVYGGGGFVKLYPARFLFVQAQAEHNKIRQKYSPGIPGYPAEKYKEDANSFLVGAGYTSGRSGRGGPPFYYLAVLFDIGNDVMSPYTNSQGNAMPIIRAGIQVPLFQGGRSRYQQFD